VNLGLSGKRALVTGSTAGIGAAIVRSLASEDVAVVIHGRDEQRGGHLADELTRAGRRAIFIGADLTVPADIGRLALQVKAAFGAIDILVNKSRNGSTLRRRCEAGVSAGMRSKRTFSRATSQSPSATSEPQTTSRVWWRFWPVRKPSSSTVRSCAWTEAVIPGRADRNGHLDLFATYLLQQQPDGLRIVFQLDHDDLTKRVQELGLV
jgi:short chain dehydrogenase